MRLLCRFGIHRMKVTLSEEFETGRLFCSRCGKPDAAYNVLADMRDKMERHRGAS